MPTVRTAFAALYAAVLLFACQSKQPALPPEKNNTAGTAAVTVPPGEAIEIQTLSDGFVNRVTQKFIVAKNKTTLLTGKKGLRVTVDPAVLEKEDGSPVDEAVEVSLVELTSSADLFKANAATLSNGRLLASGGSYYIAMHCNGQPLRIKKGKSLQIGFPVIAKDEMELFYGQRNAAGDINWLKAGVALSTETAADPILFTDSNRYTAVDFYPAFMYDTGGKAKVYKTTSEQVYLYDHKVTIKQLVDTINRVTARIFLDTVYMWPKALANLPAGTKIDSNYLNRMYGPAKQFIIKRCEDAAAAAAKNKQQQEALEKARQNYQPKTLAGQIQKYYGPAGITTLGWINCDRFYNAPGNTELQMELPITFAKPALHYFVICQSFNGLLSGTLKADSASLRYKLPPLPKGTAVTLVAFIKSGGKIYQYVNNIKPENSTILQPEFKEITAVELQKIFGSNVHI